MLRKGFGTYCLTMRVKDFRLFTAGIDQRVSRFTLVERALYGGCSIYRSRASPGWCVAGIGIGVVALLIPLPRSIENGVDLFGIVVLVCVSVFVYLVYWKTAGEPAKDDFVS